MLSRDLKREREYKLVQLLEKNIADESEARQGYFAIFQEYFDDLSMDEIWQIKEITYLYCYKWQDVILFKIG